MTFIQARRGPGGGDVGVAYCEVKYLGAHEDPHGSIDKEEGKTWTNENTGRKYGPTNEYSLRGRPRALDGSNIPPLLIHVFVPIRSQHYRRHMTRRLSTKSCQAWKGGC
jgi:hypothetical protein